MLRGASSLTRCLTIVPALLLCACGGGGGGNAGGADNPGGGYTLERVFPALTFNQLTDIQSQPYPPSAMASGDRLFVVERAGVIRVFDRAPSVANSAVFLDIRGRVTATGGEQGLLGLAFHPDFASNGSFYVHYTVETNSVPQRIRISRFTVTDQDMSPNTADPDSETVILVVDQAAEGPPQTNHNAGGLALSPMDGLLYTTTGDGGGANDPEGNGQNLGTVSGAILRINVDGSGAGYTIPADNPFAGQTGARGEIFAYGLRNPFKISFDTNGDLWIADVGQSRREEVNFLAAGDTSGPNFGWDCREGSLAGAAPDSACDGLGASDFVAPVDDYSLGGSQSITGGYVYRGRDLTTLTGRYLYADFISGEIRAFDPGSGETELLMDSPRRISTFVRDANNEIYVGDYGVAGGLHRLTAN